MCTYTFIPANSLNFMFLYTYESYGIGEVIPFFFQKSPHISLIENTVDF